MTRQPSGAPSLLILFAIVFIDLVGFGIVIPLLPFYGEHFGAPPNVVTILMATYSLAQFFAAPVWGRVSDRFGRRPVLLVGLAGTVVAYFWISFADSLAALFAARALGGLMAGNIGAAFAYAADVTTPENRAKGMGAIGAAFGLGFIAGPAIGGILGGADLAHANFELPCLVAAGFSLAALIAAAFVLGESLPPEKRALIVQRTLAEKWQALMESLDHGQIKLVIALNFFAVMVIGGIESTFAMWSERTYGWGIAQNGYLFAYMGVVIALSQGAFAGPLARRVGEATMVRVGFLCIGIGLAGIPLAPGVGGMVAAVSVTALGFSIANPALNSLLSRASGADEQGLMLGIGRSAAIFARVIGPASAGMLFAAEGRDWPFFAGALLMAALMTVVMTRLKPAAASAPESA